MPCVARVRARDDQAGASRVGFLCAYAYTVRSDGLTAVALQHRFERVQRLLARYFSTPPPHSLRLSIQRDGKGDKGHGAPALFPTYAP